MRRELGWRSLKNIKLHEFKPEGVSAQLSQYPAGIMLIEPYSYGLQAYVTLES